MRAMAARGAWSSIWHVHLASVLGLTAYSGVQFSQDLSNDPELLAAMFGRVSPIALWLTPIVLIVVFAPIVAEVGFLAQRGWSRRESWVALFAALVVLTAVGIALMALVMASPSGDGDDPFGAMAAVEGIVVVGQLVVVWLYAFRSPHLWQRTTRTAEQPA